MDKTLESLKVWEDIYRAVYPFGQHDGESREGAEDGEAVWLHKVEYSIKVTKKHLREVWCGSCCDCSHEWFKEATEMTAWFQPEDLEVFQRWHDLKCLTLSDSWK